MSEKLLVVDDHPDTREAIVMTLERHGYAVVEAESGPTALSIVDSFIPDLILLDVSMPGMDGYEVCRKLRANPALKKTPIIMFTANDNPLEKLQGFDAGADDYLTKPTRPDELINRVEMILTRSGRSTPPKSKGETDNFDEPEVVNPMFTERLDVDSWGKFEGTEEEAIPTAPAHLIAVLSARGGAGATTMAINLAHSLAINGEPTTLIDLDMIQGHIAMYLNQKVSGGINNLSSLSTSSLMQQLDLYMTQDSENLQLLLAKPNLGQTLSTLTSGQALNLLDQLLLPGKTVVVDIGYRLNDVAKTILNRATQVVVCLKPERLAILTARQMLAHLSKKTIIPEAAALHVAMLAFGGRSGLRQSAVEEFLDVPAVKVIPINDGEMTQTVNKGIPLVRCFPNGETAMRFRELAWQLVGTS